MSRRGTLHHLELWVDDVTAAARSWGWLLTELGYRPGTTWPTGRTWTRSDSYVVVESGPDHRPGRHDRLRSGVNHVAFWAGTASDVDALVAVAGEHGWSLMFAERHPFAGGPDHYAAFLEDGAGFEVELVAEPDQVHEPESGR